MDQASNLTKLTYDRVREDILLCRLAPGERINSMELCKRYSVSQGAVREALSRLAAEGLAELEPNRGFISKPLDAESFRALSEARAAIDALCLRASLQSADIEWEARLVAASYRVTQRLAQANDRPADSEAVKLYIAAHADFHEALTSQCRNPSILWIHRLLFAQSMRYRHYCLPFARTKSSFYGTEGPFLKAVLAGNAVEAERLLMQQYLSVGGLILEVLIEREAKTPPSRSLASPKHHASE